MSGRSGNQAPDHLFGHTTFFSANFSFALTCDFIEGIIYCKLAGNSILGRPITSELATNRLFGLLIASVKVYCQPAF